MPRVPFASVVPLAALLLVGCATTADEVRSLPITDQATRTLPFRAMLAGDTHPDDPAFFDEASWEYRLARWASEGYNAVVWYGPGELSSGEHVLARHDEFPEARELTPEKSERIIEHLRWRFRRAHELGLEVYILAQHLFYTGAFGVAHGLEALTDVSPEVSHWHVKGYPDFWRGGLTTDCGVWNEATRAYIEALYAELPRLYPDLDGFYGFLGEPMPGERTRLYREAIAPGLARCGRPVRFFANQWQVPLDQFLRDVAVRDLHEQTSLGFHGYNSESLTDAKPYPGVVWWSEQTALPTVVDLYPGNFLYFPLNSPRFAWEIIREMKKVPGFAGFIYWERHASGTVLGPLFREALGRYAASNEPYSDEPWLVRLEEEFGNREAARHFLEAFDAMARIIPETDALVYSGGDVLRRELRMPYAFFLGNFPWSHTASPARGGRLIPINHYAQFVARAPEVFRERDGSELDRPPFYQEALWNSEGGSIFDVTPPQHMARVRQLGERTARHAEAGLIAATRNLDNAEHVRNLARGCELLSHYYEFKVNAAITALIFAESGRPEDREEAERLADVALSTYEAAAGFMHERLDPYYIEIMGAPLTEAGKRIPELIEAERRERSEIGQIFGWP